MLIFYSVLMMTLQPTPVPPPFFSCPWSNSLVPRAACRHGQGYHLNTMNQSFALASSATESASLPPESAPLFPSNATVVTGTLEGFYAMDYTCTMVRFCSWFPDSCICLRLVHGSPPCPRQALCHF